jgi:hypothetical protein
LALSQNIGLCILAQGNHFWHLDLGLEFFLASWPKVLTNGRSKYDDFNWFLKKNSTLVHFFQKKILCTSCSHFLLLPRDKILAPKKNHGLQ